MPDEGDEFSIAQLSDGERNAVIIASAVLSVPADTIMVIDEPEQHLHLSIVEPFLTALFDSRPDCPFIISTHEIALPVVAKDARVLLPRSCEWLNRKPVSWDIDELPPGQPLPDDLRAAILGARKKMVFVEGTLSSLDTPFYNLLLPGTSVVAKGSGTDVMSAVKGLSGAGDLHWLRAFGLIDRDDRLEDEIAELETAGIFALSVYSIEAIYYSLIAIKNMARTQAKTHGREDRTLLQDALEAGLRVLSDNDKIYEMCSRRIERLVKGQVQKATPNWEEIRNGGSRHITIDIDRVKDKEMKVYGTMLENGDFDGLVRRYPVRYSDIRGRVARALLFQDSAKYEEAALAAARESEAFRYDLCELIGALHERIKEDT